MILFVHRDPKSFGDDVTFYAADTGPDAFENITIDISYFILYILFQYFYLSHAVVKINKISEDAN